MNQFKVTVLCNICHHMTVPARLRSQQENIKFQQLCTDQEIMYYYLFIFFTAQRLKVCRTLSPTACLKMLTEKHI